MNRLLAALLVLLPLLTLTAAPAPAAVADTEPTGVWPLVPRPEVVRTFDPPAVEWGSGHRGVDLRGTVGQTVRSALPGRVSYVGRIAGVGIVVVDHGATRTTYQPVEATVRVGAEVRAGAALGALEWHGTHCSPAACLHWGLVRGDTYLDPLALVGGPSPVRLLPLDGTAPLAPVHRPALPFRPRAVGGIPVPGVALRA